MGHCQLKVVDPTTGVASPIAPDTDVVATAHDRGWKTLTVESYRRSAIEMPEHIGQTHRLCILLGPSSTYEWWEGGRWQRVILRPGDIGLVPHGHPNRCRILDQIHHLNVALDPHSVDAMLGETVAGPVDFHDVRRLPDPTLVQMGKLLRAEIDQQGYGGALFGESVGLAIALVLLTRYGDGIRSSQLPKGRLSGPQLGRVIDFVQANLRDNVSLIELAAVAGLSPFHFARLFRNTMGMSPHRYVTQLRVERSMMMLKNAHGIAETAVAVGFFDQPHYTRAFKDMTGKTPGEYKTEFSDP